MISDAEFNYRERRMHVLLVIAYGAAMAAVYLVGSFTVEGLF